MIITIQQIKKFYPNLSIKELEGGCNIYFVKGTVLTLFFKNKKYHTNKMNNKDWRRWLDRADLFKVIDHWGNIDLKPVKIKAKKIQPEKVVEVADKGTCACIDHLKRKADTIKKENPNDHKLITFCKTLEQEFHQYL